MRFKRLSLALIVLSMSFSLFAAHSMFFSAGDYDTLNLYNPSGNKVDALTEITQSGYIIQTGEWDATFSSKFAEIIVYPNSLIALVGTDNPELYLLDGSIMIECFDKDVNVYTTTAKYELSKNAVAHIVYTNEEDTIANLSDKSIILYDALRDSKGEVAPYTIVDIMKASYNPLMYELRTAELYTKEIAFKDFKATLTADTQKITITLPQNLKRSQITSFLANLEVTNPEIRSKFTYRTTQDTITLKYAISLTEEEYTALTDQLAKELLLYIKSFYRPAEPSVNSKLTLLERIPNMPQFSAVKTTVIADIPSTPVFSVSGSVKVKKIN